MPDSPDLLTNLRDYLIAQSLVRDPQVAGTDPPFWRHPRDGAPAPGEKNGVEDDNDIVVSAFLTGGVPAAPYEQGVWRKRTVDIWIRTRIAPAGEDFEADLSPLLVDKWDWDMSGLRVIESQMFRDLQPLGSDDQGFIWIVSYVFQLYTD